MTKEQWIEKLKKEEFKNIDVCANPPHKEFPQHTHDQRTVHVILKGTLTLIELGDEKQMKQGDYFEIPAGTTHRALCGPEGCTFIVGVK